jgi:hypothetical protein
LPRFDNQRLDSKQAAFVRRAKSCAGGIAVTGVIRVARVMVKSNRLLFLTDREVTALEACPFRVWMSRALTITIVVDKSLWIGGRNTMITWLMIKGMP